MEGFLKGSEWRKWDLHVHLMKQEWLSNPEKEKDKIKQRTEEFIKKALEKGIEVIAITDHNTGFAIDYAIEYAEKMRNEGKNIWVLPGVELDANTAEHIIVIFNPECKNKWERSSWKDVVETFLQSVCEIEPPFFEGNTSKKVTIATKELIETINKDDIGIVIFAHCMSDNGGFFIEGGGDSQSRQSICRNFFGEFGSFIFEIKELSEKDSVKQKLERWELDSEKFPIISSSDAHKAEGIGEYYTWIKADPTYEGLKQILYEPEGRIFLGIEPALLNRLKEKPIKFIKSIKITQKSNYDESKGIWFKEIHIPLNPGMVAIIGNKGMGKSALLDIMALCGNSHRYSDFSFLNDKRFKKDKLAENFEAALEWESGETIIKNLNEEVDINAPERVKYIPQNYFEKLASDLEAHQFQKNLENIVFSYLPIEERLEKQSFEELINYKKEIIEKEIQIIFNEIQNINKKLVELDNKKHPSYKDKIEKELKEKEKELEIVDETIVNTEKILTKLEISGQNKELL